MRYHRIFTACFLTTALAFTQQLEADEVKFDVNDVSYLWPIPNSAEDINNLISASAKLDDESPIWPTATFRSVIEKAQQV